MTEQESFFVETTGLSGTKLTPNQFDGQSYDEKKDFKRLASNYTAVWNAMRDGLWHTSKELEAITGCDWAAISPRIRDFRKPKNGGYTVLRERVKGGTFRYRLLVASARKSA